MSGDHLIPSKGEAVAADLTAIGAWFTWLILNYVIEHPGEAVMWVLGLALMLMRLPTAWLDLRERWLRKHKAKPADE
jgi:hypothetical protein